MKTIRRSSLAILCCLPLMAVAGPAERAGDDARMDGEQQRGAPERGEREMRRSEDDDLGDREERLREREQRLEEREERVREREDRFRDERDGERGMPSDSERPGEEARGEERDRGEQRDRDEMPPGLADNPQAQDKVREAQSKSERGKSGSRGNRPWWQFWGSDDEEEQPEN